MEGSGDAIQGRLSQSVADGTEVWQCFHRAGFVREVPSCQSLQLLLLRALPKWPLSLTLDYGARAVAPKPQAHKELWGKGGLSNREYVKMGTQHRYRVHLQNGKKNVSCAQLVSNLWSLSFWLINLSVMLHNFFFSRYVWLPWEMLFNMRQYGIIDIKCFCVVNYWITIEDRKSVV